MPSQAERTHEWDVSDTNWDLYPVGTHRYLTCPDFSCGGLDDFSMDFHPRGFKKTDEHMTLFLTNSKGNRPHLIATWQIRLESKGFPTKTLHCCGDLSLVNCVHIPYFKGVVGVDKISAIVMCVEHKYQPEDVQQAGIKDELSARLKVAERCEVRANGVGGVAISAGAASGRILSNTGGAAISGGAVSNAEDLADDPTQSKKRPRTEGLEEAPDPKRLRTTLTKPLDTLLGLYIGAALDSSEVVVRCGDRQV